MTRNRNQRRVTGYNLTADQVILKIKEGDKTYEHPVSRRVFEIWLTDGTDVVDMSFSHCIDNVVTEVPVKVGIDEYWEKGDKLDNSPILEHLKLFLQYDEGRTAVAKCA